MRLENTVGGCGAESDFFWTQQEKVLPYLWQMFYKNLPSIVVHTQYKQCNGVDRYLYMFRHVAVCGWLPAAKWLN